MKYVKIKKTIFIKLFRTVKEFKNLGLERVDPDDIFYDYPDPYSEWFFFAKIVDEKKFNYSKIKYEEFCFNLKNILD